MYQEFYQLSECPFNVTADPNYFFSSTRHSQAFSHVIYGITQRKGIVAITGEVGTGKTTLCRMLLNSLDDTVKTAIVLNPKFSETELLQVIIHDLGIRSTSTNKYDLVENLNKFLIDESNRGHNVVIIIDEAQNLSIEQLENVRLLSNLETEKQKLLQILLVGQPELDAKLRLPALRQLNQRITVRCKILPLDKEELAQYIQHRINQASLEGKRKKPLVFTQSAIDEIYAYTKGTPRLVNILCDYALLAGYVAETFTIDNNIISQCAEEVFQL